MAVIELNLLNSQNEFSQMGEHFQDEHNLQKCSTKWESTLPIGRTFLQICAGLALNFFFCKSAGQPRLNFRWSCILTILY